jgi:F0F1-type ATP synthase assembly protein I
MSWASRVTSVSLGFVVPTLLGYYLDVWLHSSPWGVLIGMALGFAAGMLQLLRIAREGSDNPQPPRRT